MLYNSIKHVLWDYHQVRCSLFLLLQHILNRSIELCGFNVGLASIFILQVVVKKRAQPLHFFGYKTTMILYPKGVQNLFLHSFIFQKGLHTVCVPDELLEIKVEPFGGCKMELDWLGGNPWSGVLPLLLLNIGLRNTTNWGPSLYIRSFWGLLAQKYFNEKHTMYTYAHYCRLFCFLSSCLTHTHTVH